jgi:HAD superfamily hydrolase (TIGR01509 family)
MRWRKCEMVIEDKVERRIVDAGGRFRTVAFDFDGLLFNTEEMYHEVGQTILARRRRKLSAGLVALMRGKPNRVALQAMIDWHGLDDSVEQLLRETDALFEPLLATRLAPMPGAAELLDHLEQTEMASAVVTSGRRGFVMPILEKYGWADRFSFVLTAEDVVLGKPHPEPYLEAARRFGIPAEQLLVLEDSEHGCAAAVAAGSGVVCVPSERAAVQPDGVLFVAASLEDPRIIDLLGVPRCLEAV